MLETKDFTDALGGCCAELQHMTGPERLDWFDSETLATEMVHNFGSGGGAGSDETVQLGNNATYFYNLWEIAMLAPPRMRAPVHTHLRPVGNNHH